MRSLCLGAQSFPDALRGLVARVAEGYPACAVVAVKGAFEDVPDFVAGNLLLVVQEVVNNAFRHGRPSTVERTVSDDPAAGRIEVQVHDDGAGFTVGGQMGLEQGHFGIHGVRERVERLEGSLRIESLPGRGTTVVANVARRDYDRALEETGSASHAERRPAGG